MSRVRGRGWVMDACSVICATWPGQRRHVGGGTTWRRTYCKCVCVVTFNHHARCNHHNCMGPLLTVAFPYRYGSVRIDAVHYCDLEEILAEKRQKKHMFKAVVEAGDVPAIRLNLFCRTVRESHVLASRVTLLKLPYMTRETCKADLARTVSALPNIRYVDLPDGAFTGDPSCHPLVHELQARCPDIRKMSYRSGAEASFELLARRNWQALEILELNNIAVEPSTLRLVLASLPTLHELTMSEIPWLDDSIFTTSPLLPDFPPLQSLSLEGIPLLTSQGLLTYLSKAQNRAILSSLSLNNTGVTVQDVHAVVWEAASLTFLAIVETVSKSMALELDHIEPLTSISLKVLHFEITDHDDAHGLQKPASSYYAYLAQSLAANSMPALEQLYVRDPEFAELLLLPPPVAPFANGTRSRASTLSNAAPRGFHQPLEVFSKGLDELEWVFTAIAPPSVSGRRGSSVGGRPISAYSASRGLGPQWAQGGFGGDARKSVIVGNGFGGFLAIPQEETPRPMSTAFVVQDGGGGGRNSKHWATSSVGSTGSAGSRGSWLKPPPSLASGGHARKSSRQDLWR